MLGRFWRREVFQAMAHRKDNDRSGSPQAAAGRSPRREETLPRRRLPGGDERGGGPRYDRDTGATGCHPEIRRDPPAPASRNNPQRHGRLGCAAGPDGRGRERFRILQGDHALLRAAPAIRGPVQPLHHDPRRKRRLEELIARISSKAGIGDYQVLESLEEFKKSSMEYF